MALVGASAGAELRGAPVAWLDGWEGIGNLIEESIGRLRSERCQCSVCAGRRPAVVLLSALPMEQRFLSLVTFYRFGNPWRCLLPPLRGKPVDVSGFMEGSGKERGFCVTSEGFGVSSVTRCC